MFLFLTIIDGSLTDTIPKKIFILPHFLNAAKDAVAFKLTYRLDGKDPVLKFSEDTPLKDGFFLFPLQNTYIKKNIFKVAIPEILGNDTIAQASFYIQYARFASAFPECFDQPVVTNDVLHFVLAR